MEAAKGCNKDITARTQVICDRCDGKRAEPGTTYSTCSTCKGTGQVLMGQWDNLLLKCPSLSVHTVTLYLSTVRTGLLD